MHYAKKEAFISFTSFLIKQKHIFRWICLQVSGIIPWAMKHVVKKFQKNGTFGYGYTKKFGELFGHKFCNKSVPVSANHV
jgi:hypothetical protein